MIARMATTIITPVQTPNSTRSPATSQLVRLVLKNKNISPIKNMFFFISYCLIVLYTYSIVMPCNHYQSFLYLKRKNSVTKFSSNEKAFVIIIGKSSLRIPQQIHRLIPTIKKRSIPIETSSAFFSLMIFIAWGNRELAVNMPAIIPMICVNVSLFKIFRQFLLTASEPL